MCGLARDRGALGPRVAIGRGAVRYASNTNRVPRASCELTRLPVCALEYPVRELYEVATLSEIVRLTRRPGV